MLIIALIFHVLGHHIPLWITKTKMNELRAQFKWKQLLFEMSGVITCFISACILIVVISLIAEKDRYLLNKNAIYGIECSPEAKDLGFKDGDKIISINDKEVIKFSDFFSHLLSELGVQDAKVKILRDTSEMTITASFNDALELIRHHKTHFKPKLKPDSITGNAKELVYTESREGIGERFRNFFKSAKTIIGYFLPHQSHYSTIGGFVSISARNITIVGVLYLLAFSLVFVGLFNLLPIPGLDIGNTLIALIEKARMKKFNPKILQIIKLVCISLLVLVFIVISNAT